MCHLRRTGVNSPPCLLEFGARGRPGLDPACCVLETCVRADRSVLVGARLAPRACETSHKLAQLCHTKAMVTAGIGRILGAIAGLRIERQ